MKFFVFAMVAAFLLSGCGVLTTENIDQARADLKTQSDAALELAKERINSTKEEINKGKESLNKKIDDIKTATDEVAEAGKEVKEAVDAVKKVTK